MFRLWEKECRVEIIRHPQCWGEFRTWTTSEEISNQPVDSVISQTIKQTFLDNWFIHWEFDIEIFFFNLGCLASLWYVYYFLFSQRIIHHKEKLAGILTNDTHSKPWTYWLIFLTFYPLKSPFCFWHTLNAVKLEGAFGLVWRPLAPTVCHSGYSDI